MGGGHAPQITVALATSGAVGSVAIALDGAVVHAESFREGLVHGREIVPRLRTALLDLGLPPQRIALVAADVGPGSFTGMRVGVTTAKALAYASGAAVVAVRSTDAIAANLPVEAGPRCVLVDAKRGQIYAAGYRVEGARLVRAAPLRLVRPEEVATSADPTGFLLGDALAVFGERFRSEGFRLAGEADWLPRAERVLEIGLRERDAGRLVPVEALVPLYLRPSAPEERLRGGRPAAPD